jgi:hypothetical protein
MTLRTQSCLAFILSGGMFIASGIACPPTDSSADPNNPTGQVVALSAVREVPEQQAQRAVDLAICLDTSGSMQGLIESAKIKLWDIVNDLALAKPAPKLRVALLTYGNDGHNAETGWVRVDAPLTEDLDAISRQLFALTTNGGTELVGRVVNAAQTQLDWSHSNEALKLIVVAGNESADQDQQMPFRDVCKATISRGIMINSIYCGNLADDIAPAWKEVAMLADGHFAAIDHNNGTVVIATPFDDELARLGVALNATYIPYGSEGARCATNQQEQDGNAQTLGTAVAAQRAVTKGCGQVYWNGNWDLVDACQKADFKLEDVKDADLPENMRAMSVEQRRTHVTEMQTKRADLQTQINDLNVKRQLHVAEEMKKLADAGDKSFDAAIRKAIRAQAQAKGFAFEELKPAAAAQPEAEGDVAMFKQDDC